MKNVKTLLILTATLLLVSGCADVTPVSDCIITTEPYGFWSGLWHGMILPFSFIGRLFSDDIAIYAINNNGRWYDFGFVFGTGGIATIVKGFVAVLNGIIND